MDIQKTYETTFPIFRKYGKSLFYKIISDDLAIRVTTHEGLDTVLPTSALERTDESTEEEFEKAFDTFLTAYKLTRL